MLIDQSGGGIWFQVPIGFIMLFFFGLWNSGMSYMMVQMVWAPMSNGICGCVQIILLLFPHWYIGIIVPTLVGGIIPGLLTVLVPYGIVMCISCKKEMWGCQHGNQEATAAEYAEAVDCEGDAIKIGDKVIQEYTVPGSKHRSSYQDTRTVTLTMMSHNKRWKGVAEAKSEEGMCAGESTCICEAKSITLKNGGKNKNNKNMVPASHMQMTPQAQWQQQEQQMQMQPGHLMQPGQAGQPVPMQQMQPMMIQQPIPMAQPMMQMQQVLPGQPMPMQMQQQQPMTMHQQMQPPMGQPMVDPVTGKQMEYDPNMGHGMPVMH